MNDWLGLNLNDHHDVVQFIVILSTRYWWYAMTEEQDFENTMQGFMWALTERSLITEYTHDLRMTGRYSVSNLTYYP